MAKFSASITSVNAANSINNSIEHNKNDRATTSAPEHDAIELHDQSNNQTDEKSPIEENNESEVKNAG